MKAKESMWENFHVYGDTKELDKIISTPGIISFDRNDIVNVLETEGESFIVAVQAPTLSDAITSAFEKISLSLSAISDMAIALWSSNAEFPMSEMMAVNNLLANLDADPNVSWGIFTDTTINDSFKVTIIATGQPMKRD